MKRILQLTGRRLSDPVLSSSSTLAHLYYALLAKPEPKRLAQTPQLRKLNLMLPNATVHNRRQTPIDKDKAVGRWKIIEEELEARGLRATKGVDKRAKAGAY